MSCSICSQDDCDREADYHVQQAGHPPRGVCTKCMLLIRDLAAEMDVFVRFAKVVLEEVDDEAGPK